jgi:hypothetical protein
MATGAIDANGIWQYAEDDQLASPNWSAYMNKLAASVSATMTDTGWITTGLSYASGWSSSTTIGGWQSFAYRRIGKMVRANGVVIKSSGAAADETIVTMPVSVRPVTNFLGVADQAAGRVFMDVLTTGTLRLRGVTLPASTPLGIDLAWWLG